MSRKRIRIQRECLRAKTHHKMTTTLCGFLLFSALSISHVNMYEIHPSDSQAANYVVFSTTAHVSWHVITDITSRDWGNCAHDVIRLPLERILLKETGSFITVAKVRQGYGAQNDLWSISTCVSICHHHMLWFCRVIPLPVSCWILTFIKIVFSMVLHRMLRFKFYNSILIWLLL